MDLRRTISQRALMFISLNAILGTGIFILPAIGARHAGASSIISWLIMAPVAIIISLYFAELSSKFQKSGGIYEFVRAAFGEFWGFMFGWMAWIIANVTIAMLVIGSLIYIFPSASPVFYILVSVLTVVIFSLITMKGIEISSRISVIFGIFTVGILAALIIPGIFAVKAANFAALSFSPSVFVAVYLIAETFFGWETVTYISEEVKNARKVVPRTLALATVIIGLLSILLVTVLIGVIGAAELGMQSAPLAYLAGSLFGPESVPLFTFLVFIPLIGTAFSWIVASPRLLYAMSRDKVMIPSFRKLHAKYRTPYIAIGFQAVVIIFITLLGIGNFESVLTMLLPMTIIAYSAVMLSAFKLHRMKGGFKSPLGRAGPVMVILFNIFILGMWISEFNSFAPIVYGFLFLLVGIPLYISIKLRSDPRFIEKFYDRTSWLTDKMLPLWYGEAESRSVASKLGLNRNHVVLDFGAGSGHTTRHISSKAKKVIAIDLSRRQLMRAAKYVRTDNVIFVKENGVRKFGKESFDAVAAVGVLEHFENPEIMILKLMKLLKKNGRFCFVFFGSTMGIPPSHKFSSKQSIKHVMKKAGIEARVEKRTRNMADMWFVWGKKDDMAPDKPSFS